MVWDQFVPALVIRLRDSSRLCIIISHAARGCAPPKVASQSGAPRLSGKELTSPISHRGGGGKGEGEGLVCVYGLHYVSRTAAGEGTSIRSIYLLSMHAQWYRSNAKFPIISLSRPAAQRAWHVHQS